MSRVAPDSSRITQTGSLRVGVISGGPNGEHEVSLLTAAGVIQALEEAGHQVVELPLDEQLTASLLARPVDLIFPAVHGAPGEDGTLQGMLDLMGLPYVGSGVEASVLGMNKVLSKQQFRLAGLTVPEAHLVTSHTNTATTHEEIHRRLGERLVIKPITQGSALGVRLLDEVEQLAEALQEALTLGTPAMVEPFVQGREITVAVLETEAGISSLPIIEITTPGGTWYDYERRYTPGLAEHIIPAPLSDKLSDTLKEAAIKAHRSLGCRDLSRADFIVTEDNCWLLEVNTLPGMTPTSLYPDAAQAAGMSFKDLTSLLVHQAWRRGPRRFV